MTTPRGFSLLCEEPRPRLVDTLEVFEENDENPRARFPPSKAKRVQAVLVPSSVHHVHRDGPRTPSRMSAAVDTPREAEGVYRE